MQRTHTEHRRGENLHAAGAMLQSYLHGIDYPARRDDLRETARRNGAPDDVMQLIGRLPDREYDYPTDVQREASKIKE